MINVKIKLFAAVRDIVGTGEKILSFPPSANPSTIIETLIEEYPRMQEWKDHLRVAVNCEYVSLDHQLRNMDEVAIIPPVSGG